MIEQLDYLYFPGCSVKRDARSYEETAFDVFKALGLRVKELDKWWCCGATFGLAVDDVARHMGSVRSLIQAEKESVSAGTNKLLTLCPMCYNTLKRVNLTLKKDPGKLSTIKKYLMDENLDYNLSVEVVHVLEPLFNVRDKIRQLVKRKGNGIRAAPYYGCTPLRPREVAIDSPEAPTIMHSILEASGVQVVDFPFKSECCGAYVSIYNRKAAVAKSSMIIIGAAKAGANILVTVCPLCHYNLMLAYREMKHKPNIKIVYLTELLAYLMGIDDHVPPDIKAFLDSLQKIEARQVEVS